MVSFERRLKRNRSSVQQADSFSKTCQDGLCKTFGQLSIEYTLLCSLLQASCHFLLSLDQKHELCSYGSVCKSLIFLSLYILLPKRENLSSFFKVLLSNIFFLKVFQSLSLYIAWFFRG